MGCLETGSVVIHTLLHITLLIRSQPVVRDEGFPFSVWGGSVTLWHNRGEFGPKTTSLARATSSLDGLVSTTCLSACLAHVPFFGVSDSSRSFPLSLLFLAFISLTRESPRALSPTRAVARSWSLSPPVGWLAPRRLFSFMRF